MKEQRTSRRNDKIRSTLFPDLDGLARSLAFELEHHYAFDPTISPEGEKT